MNIALPIPDVQKILDIAASHFSPPKFGSIAEADATLEKQYGPQALSEVQSFAHKRAALLVALLVGLQV